MITKNSIKSKHHKNVLTLSYSMCNQRGDCGHFIPWMMMVINYRERDSGREIKQKDQRQSERECERERERTKQRKHQHQPSAITASPSPLALTGSAELEGESFLNSFSFFSLEHGELTPSGGGNESLDVEGFCGRVRSLSTELCWSAPTSSFFATFLSVLLLWAVQPVKNASSKFSISQSIILEAFCRNNG